MFPAVAALALFQATPPQYPQFWELQGTYLPMRMIRVRAFASVPATTWPTDPTDPRDPWSLKPDPLAGLKSTLRAAEEELGNAHERLSLATQSDRPKDEIAVLRSAVERLAVRLEEVRAVVAEVGEVRQKRQRLDAEEAEVVRKVQKLAPTPAAPAKGSG